MRSRTRKDTHMGMLILLQTLWAYFLTQKSPANHIQSIVKQHKCALQKIDSLKREGFAGVHVSLQFLDHNLTEKYTASQSTVKKMLYRAMFLSSLPTPHTLRALPVQDKMSGNSCGS